MLGLAFVFAIVAASLVAPLIESHPPTGKNTETGLSELGRPLPPSAEHPLGTDMLGRCVAARVAHGARTSLEIGIAAALLALAIGLALGMLAGYCGGWADALIMRLVDLVLAFPFLLLVIAVAAALGRGSTGTGTVIAVLGLVGWTGIARIVRGKVLVIREQEYISAAVSLGAGRARIIGRHVLPNLIGPVIVLASIFAAQMILAESTLAFLGLGAPPPEPTWGRMLSEAQPFIRGAPWLFAAPGLAILLTVVGFNLLGEGLRDALDPSDRA